MKAMKTCPHCQDSGQQVKAGRTGYGSQMYKCNPCDRRYVAQTRRYSREMRQLAVACHAAGLSYRQIARRFRVHHVTIMNWVKAGASQQPPAPNPRRKPVNGVEMGELQILVERKRADDS